MKKFCLDVCIVGGVLGLYATLALQNLSASFIGVSDDATAFYAVAARNVAERPLELKLGIIGQWVEDPEKAFGNFYTHHPAGALLPAVVTYKLFGMTEGAARFGPFALTVASLIIFYFALKRIFKGNLAIPFLILLTFVVLPASVYYGKLLDVWQIALPLSLITFSLFVFHGITHKRLYLFLFLVSVLWGGLSSWFYYFMPGAVFLFMVFSKAGKKFSARKVYLMGIPSLLGGAFLANLLHFYVLNGARSLPEIFDAFLFRAGRDPVELWMSAILDIARQSFTLVFLLAFAAGLAWWFFRYRSDERLGLLMPLFFMPFLVLFVFSQASTHPFGLILFLPAVAVGAGIFFYGLLQKKDLWSIAMVGGVMLAGSFFCLRNVQVYYDWHILEDRDILLLKEFKDRGESMCIGREPIGLLYEGIFSWYVQKPLLASPDCFEKEPDIALVFHPKRGELYEKEVALFKDHNFRMVRCADFLCVMARASE